MADKKKNKKKKYTSHYKTVQKHKNVERDFSPGKDYVGEVGFGDTEKMKNMGNVTEMVSQIHDKKKGTVTENYSTRDKSGNITKKIETTVPAEQLYFKKSKGPMLTTSSKSDKEQNNRNNKRKITYNV